MNRNAPGQGGDGNDIPGESIAGGMKGRKKVRERERKSRREGGMEKEEDKREACRSMALGDDGKHAVRYHWALKYETIVIKE